MTDEPPTGQNSEAEPETAGSADGAAATPASPRLRRALWAGGVLLAIALGAVGVFLVFGGGEVKQEQDRDTKIYAFQRRPLKDEHDGQVDGLVVDASNSKMVLRTRAGEKESFTVRPPDGAFIDIQHAQSHASLGQPVRVYWKRIDGKRCLVFLEDSPEIFG